MAVTFDSCVKSIVCTLTLPVLAALGKLVDTYIIAVDAQIANVIAQKIALDIALAPVNIIVNTFTTTLDSLKSVSKLLPVNILEGCGDLGRVMKSIDTTIDGETMAIQDALADANRLTSLSSELDGKLASLNVQKDQFSAFKTIVNECVTENQ